jgi:glucans biosynthesis protein C
MAAFPLQAMLAAHNVRAKLTKKKGTAHMSLVELIHTTTARRTAAAPATARLAYVDTLRVFLAGLVVAHHAGQAYGPTGGDWPVFNPTRAAILGPFFAVNAAFFMGLFFLIAGYFVPYAYDRKGPARFLTDRLVRLGVPLLMTSLVLSLITSAQRGQEQSLSDALLTYLLRPEVGHLWFAGHLIVYAFGYVAWRRLTRQHGKATERLAPPNHGRIVVYTLGLAVISFLVRTVFPIDRWVYLAPFIRAELAHVPQYLSLFVLGIVAYRRDWFGQLPTAVGMVWLRVGLLAATLPYAITVLRELTPLNMSLFSAGGMHVSALIWSTVEACICVGLCVGLLTVFRERANRQGALVRELAAESYGVYVIHVFPVVGLQMALAASPLAPLAKFGIVTLLAVPLCFGLTYLLRRLPGVTRVL